MILGIDCFGIILLHGLCAFVGLFMLLIFLFIANWTEIVREIEDDKKGKDNYY